MFVCHEENFSMRIEYLNYSLQKLESVKLENYFS